MTEWQQQRPIWTSHPYSVAIPEIERRAPGSDRPVLGHWVSTTPSPSFTIVGAGGLSNAVPEAVAHSHRGARVDLRAVPNGDPGMSPLEIWCNEAQERYVIAPVPTGA